MQSSNDGIQEVSGSIPLISTISNKTVEIERFQRFCYISELFRDFREVQKGGFEKLECFVTPTLNSLVLLSSTFIIDNEQDDSMHYLPALA